MLLPCTFTVSGAQSGTGTCMVNAAHDAAKGGIAFTVTDSTSAFTFTFGAVIMGQTQVMDGTYTLANAVAGAGAEYVLLPSSAWMMCTTSQNCHAAGGGMTPPQGSFTLTITNPGPVVAGVLWQQPQGTLKVILPAQPGGPASGTVTVDVTL